MCNPDNKPQGGKRNLLLRIIIFIISMMAVVFSAPLVLSAPDSNQLPQQDHSKKYLVVKSKLYRSHCSRKCDFLSGLESSGWKWVCVTI